MMVKEVEMMMRIRFEVLFLLLVMIISFTLPVQAISLIHEEKLYNVETVQDDGPEEIPPEPEYCTIEVKVLRYVTDEPIEGATVKLDGENPETTSSTGIVTYPNVPSGHHIVTASKDGYKPYIAYEEITCYYTKCVVTLRLYSVEEKPQVHDLAIVNYDIPSSAIVEDTVTFSVTVKNEGNYHESSYIRYYVSGSQICKQSISLGSGDKIRKTCDWTATKGTHTVKIKVDVVSGEADTADNVVSEKITVSEEEHPDISVSPPSWSETLTQGETATKTFTIENEGEDVLLIDSVTESASWLTITEYPDDYHLSPVESTTFKLKMDSNSLDPDTYSTQVHVKSNDPDEGDYAIPIKMKVVEVISDPPEYQINVYDVEADPYSVEEGEDVTISGKVKLVEAPSGYHDVTIKWYVDDDREHTRTRSMKEGDVYKASWDFDTDRLSEGKHYVKIKAIVDSKSDYDTDYFRVEEEIDEDEVDIEIEDLDVDPSRICVDRSKRVKFSVRVTLGEGPDNTEVTARFYVKKDGYWKKVGKDERRLDEDETRTFSVNYYYKAHYLDVGIHKVKVIVEDGTDKEVEYSKLYVDDCEEIYYPGIPGHCLSIDRIWTDRSLKAGERVNAYVRVGSCGTVKERDVKIRLTAFSRSYYSNLFTIPRGGTKDVIFGINVPEDAVGSYSFEAMAWNSYTSDTWSKNFDIKMSKSMVSVKPEYRVEDCKVTRIAFNVINTGDVKDTFTISLSGPAAGWITGVPEKITLNAGQTERVNAYVSVPCDTEEDFYQFTITAKDSSDYTVTSGLRVKKAFAWPRVSFPTGFFIGATGILLWLPWILLFIMLILFYWLGNEIVSERRRPMFY